ncbi:MAG TPA: copper chaperone PCu(A)C [Candidatus Sulfotelmatobacter sp.]|jgi:copper(I)-binding protein|nr:copper chaperone PCu(A)C [Candidatus Sulfotelmatobacter sp.]
MRTLRRILFSLTCLLALPLAAAQAHETKAGDLVIEHPWSRATTGQNGVVYMVIENHGKTADKLTAVSTTISDMPMLHTNYMEGEVMKMRMVDSVDVPAGGQVALKPGSFHIMLMGLKAPLKEGQMFPLTLTFEKTGKVEVNVMVQAAGAPDAEHHHQPETPKQ